MKKMIDPMAWTVVVRGWLSGVLLAMLAACGGGGADGDGGGGGGGGDVATYEALPYVTARAELLNQLNIQGARGYVFIGARSYGADLQSPSEMVNLYVKEGSSTYGYEVLDTLGTPSEMLAQMNAQGERLSVQRPMDERHDLCEEKRFQCEVSL